MYLQPVGDHTLADLAGIFYFRVDPFQPPEHMKQAAL
jgi:hypothetical protein